jgi:3-hydroxyisobutyrate dehydrogenase
MSKISFIGIGIMGGPIARHLASAGHDLTVYNRSASKADAWVAENGGRAATSPADAAAGADVVMSCVGTDDDLASLALGRDGAFGGMTKGALFIDHSAVSARIARQLSVEAKSRGIQFIDAPVTGGQAGAKAGKLAIMCGGRKEAVEAACPIMQAYAKRIVHVGGAGAGQTAKMANQIAMVSIIQGVAEALHFAQCAEVDLDKVYEAISGGAAQSWQMDNNWASMAKGEFDFGFAVDWMRKDLGLALDEARANGASLPNAAQVDQYFSDVQYMGGGRQDTSSLIRRLPKR